MAETTTNKATETARAAAASVPQRLAELRDLAAEDPWRAQEETWAWIEEPRDMKSDRAKPSVSSGSCAARHAASLAWQRGKRSAGTTVE